MKNLKWISIGIVVLVALVACPSPSTSTGTTATDKDGVIGSITGDAFVGSTLTAGAVTDPDGATNITYQWFITSNTPSNGTLIVGATSDTYILVNADANNYIYVVGSYIDGFDSKADTVTSTITEQIRIPDTTPPTLVITNSGATAVSDITYTLTFSEDVTGVNSTNISIGNGAINGEIVQNGNVYTVVVTPTTIGIVTITVKTGVTDTSGNALLNDVVDNTVTYTDKTPPTLNITNSGTVSEGDIYYALTFSEDVTGVNSTNVNIINGTINGAITQNGNVYTVVVTPTADGTVTITVGTGVMDISSNALASAVIDDTVTYTVPTTPDTENPVFSSGTTATTIDERIGAGNVIYTATATDNRGVTGYTLGTDGDSGDFTIDTTSGAVTLTGEPNFETKPSYTFSVIATDAAGNTATQTVTLEIIKKVYTPATIDELKSAINTEITAEGNDADLNNIDTSMITDMSSLFRQYTVFNGDISGWDTGQVTDMNHMFHGATAFTGDISKWNTVNVTDMSYMFNVASAFNGDISQWKTENVTKMDVMFNGATSFNSNISGWVVGQVTTMDYMFNAATAFLQELEPWNVPYTTNKGNIFTNSGLTETSDPNIPDWIYAYNPKPIDRGELNTAIANEEALQNNYTTPNFNMIDTSLITDMGSLFVYRATFNGDISGWDTGLVTDMHNMFYGASTFNGDISQWNVLNVTNMRNMFAGATAFLQELEPWNVPYTTDKFNIFSNSGLTETSDPNIPDWIHAYNPKPIDRGELNTAIAKEKALQNNYTTPNLNMIDTSLITDMSSLFIYSADFNGDISGWDTGLVTTMNKMFYGASTFNGDISQWNILNVTNMINMFNGATAFLQELEPWNVPYTTDKTTIFSNSGLTETSDPNIPDWIHAYNPKPIDRGELDFAIGKEKTLQNNYTTPNLNMIDTSLITDMNSLFLRNADFNGDISGWDTGLVTNMHNMFNGASTFNGDISQWNTVNVTNMTAMFSGATAFASDLSEWKTGSVTAMNQMFSGATNFNSDISSWVVNNVTTMTWMFQATTAFNADISSWVVDNVTDLSRMFQNSTAFNVDISSWNVANVINLNNVFLNSTAFEHDLELWNTSPSSTTEASKVNTFLDSLLQSNTDAGLTPGIPTWYTP